MPFISDIPVIGNLFRSTTGHREKINLLIFLTPHIIRDAAEHRDKSIEERDKLKAFMEERGIRYRKRKILDDAVLDARHSRPEGEPEHGRGRPRQGRDDLPARRRCRPRRATTAAAEPTGQEMAAIDVTPSGDRGDPRRAATGRAACGPSRYVLLASFAEMGTPPPGLQSNSGLIAVELPENSQPDDAVPGRRASTASPATSSKATTASWRPTRRRRRPCWSIPRGCRSMPPRATTCTGGRSTTQHPLTRRPGLRYSSGRWQ